MENKTKDILALFVSNVQIIRKEFNMHNIMTKRLAALLYAQKNKAIDCEAIKQSYKIIKQNTGIFSSFRGNMALCVAALLSLSPDPQELFHKTLQVFDILKFQKMRASDYLAVAAFEIASQTDPVNYQNAVNRTRDFYDGMKSKNYFVTGQDDYIFAAMLGLSDLDIISGTERIAEIVKRLKNEFWSKNSVQNLSQVLALGNSCDETVSRVLSLRDALRAQQIKLDKEYSLPSLGVLALLPVATDVIVRDIEEAQQILRSQKGFGRWSISKQELLIYAAAVTALEYAGNANSDVVTAIVSTSLTNIIIAQQIAIIVAASVSASSTATASSS